MWSSLAVVINKDEVRRQIPGGLGKGQKGADRRFLFIAFLFLYDHIALGAAELVQFRSGRCNWALERRVQQLTPRLQHPKLSGGWVGVG